MERLKLWLLISLALALLCAQPASAAIECDNFAHDTLCHVYIPTILTGEQAMDLQAEKQQVLASLERLQIEVNQLEQMLEQKRAQCQQCLGAAWMLDQLLEKQAQVAESPPGQ